MRKLHTQLIISFLYFCSFILITGEIKIKIIFDFLVKQIAKIINKDNKMMKRAENIILKA